MTGCYGRGRRTRTLGTRFWRPLLYQLSYTPMYSMSYSVIGLVQNYHFFNCIISAQKNYIVPNRGLHQKYTFLSTPERNIERFWWAFGDLNPGPSGYEPDALTN